MAGTGFALRRSKAVIGAWFAVVGLCSLLGLASGNSLVPTVIMAPGTDSARWYEMTSAADFGANISVLLSGPERELRRQGTELTGQLRDAPGVRVLSPYDAGNRSGRVGSLKLLRDDSALILANVPARTEQQPAVILEPVHQAIRDTVHAPVTSRITGGPAIGEGLSEAGETATRKAEMLAIPLLIFVLLLIFRSPVGAAIPLIMGMGTTAAASGLVKAIATQLAVDQIAVTVTSMMALALGVDYSLLLVSRYREYRREDPEAIDANIAAASGATGRTIAFAAVLLIGVICAGAALAVGPTLASAALGMFTATTFGALSAIYVAPAVVKELDPWLDRWQLPWVQGERQSRLAGRQPILIPILALVGLLALAAPTLGLEPGTPDVRLLPKDSTTRADYEEISKSVGPGFGTVFNVSFQSHDERPLTNKRTLDAITSVQRELAADPDIDAVLGPAEISEVNKEVPAVEQALTDQSGMARLDRGLGQAAKGSRSAGDGADSLHSATGRTESGSAAQVEGLESAERGSKALANGVGEASGGSTQLADAAVGVSDGASKLSKQVAQASKTSAALTNNAEVLRNDLQAGSDDLIALGAPIGSAEDNLARAWHALDAMTIGRDDPEFRDAQEATRAASEALTGTDPDSGEQIDPGYAGVAAGIDDAKGQVDLGLYLSSRLRKQGQQTRRGVGQLAEGANKVNAGVKRLSAGNERLSNGLVKLAANGVRLPEGLGKLVIGANQLTAGLAQVEAGAGKLSSNIGGSTARPGQLTNGIEQMKKAVSKQVQSGQSGRLEQKSPELFDSGMFSLALISGTPTVVRDRAQFVLDLSNSGRTAQITAFPDFSNTDPRVDSLRGRLVDAADRIERPGLEAVVGGPAAMLEDYKDASAARLPWTVLAFILISLLILVVAVRSIPLAALCVLLNLLTVGVTFGVMQIGFGSDDPLLGGAGYVDVVSMSLTLAIVFALSIDYQVFLLARIREEYRTTGDNERALTAAIGSTARVITGAAIVMVAIFLAFCVSSFISIRQMGVGLAVAVALDATAVRLILLPTAMRLAGDRIWWFPNWLDRRLPDVSL